ncbi:uncharacterized protein LOC115804703 [Chanos chanos]|uniref:Uncharacterized protein LOC115804703 n=1 Tax=Chanos chanos TaxID=29144 RepID=A0A6J2UM19_CHACN|nr:uncharacterized protein LOC115804703 [Chanos chanos]
MLLNRIYPNSEDETPKTSPGPIWVPIEMQYQLGERTEMKIKEAGAACIEETTVTEDYYDTEEFQLASRQTWLSKQNGQWRLILEQYDDSKYNDAVTDRVFRREDGPQKCGSENKTIEPRPAFTEKEDSMGGSQGASEIKGENKCIGSDVREPKDSQGQSEASCSTPQRLNESPSSSLHSDRLRYVELITHGSIIKHLVQVLKVPLKPQHEQDMTMEDILEMAHIQMFGSWTVKKTLKYLLPGQCMLVMERNYTIPGSESTAVLSMNADVLNVSSELEKMDKIASELDLRHKQC